MGVLHGAKNSSSRQPQPCVLMAHHASAAAARHMQRSELRLRCLAAASAAVHARTHRRMRSQEPMASSKKVRLSSMRMRASSCGRAARMVSAITCAGWGT